MSLLLFLKGSNADEPGGGKVEHWTVDGPNWDTSIPPSLLAKYSPASFELKLGTEKGFLSLCHATNVRGAKLSTALGRLSATLETGIQAQDDELLTLILLMERS